jgi:hypothetical protein
MKTFITFACIALLVNQASAQGNPSLYLSNDGGIHWNAFAKGLPNDVNVSHYVVKDSTIFIGTSGHGLYRFVKDRWQAVSTIAPTAFITAMAVFDERIFISVRGEGVLVSSDGKRWMAFNENLPTKGIRALYSTREKLFAGGDNGIYCSTKGGPWTILSSGKQINALTVFRKNIYAATNQGILCSVDDGQSWTFTWKRDAIFDFAEQKQGLAAMSSNREVLILLENEEWLEVTPFLKFRYTVRLTPGSPVILRRAFHSELIRKTIFHSLISLPDDPSSMFLFDTPKGLLLAVRKPGDGC